MKKLLLSTILMVAVTISARAQEQGWELFYDVVVTPWVSIGADVQFIDSPLDDTDTAVIGGLRAKIRF